MTKHFLLFETMSSSVAQARLKLQIPLPQLCQCWDYRHAPLFLVLLLVLKSLSLEFISIWMIKVRVGSNIQHAAEPLRTGKAHLLILHLPALHFGDEKIREMGKL